MTAAVRYAGSVLVAFVLGAILTAIVSFNAWPRDDGQWSNSPPEIREWFQSVMQPDHPRQSCCGEADGYEADGLAGNEGDDPLNPGNLRVVVTNGRGVIPDGQIVYVPRQKIQVQYGNPTGHGIVFIGASGQVYCYIPAGDGI